MQNQSNNTFRLSRHDFSFLKFSCTRKTLSVFRRTIVTHLNKLSQTRILSDLYNLFKILRPWYIINFVHGIILTTLLKILE